MKFKIDLNPYPGALYFTVQEHLRTYKKEICNAKGNIQSSEQNLRELYKIPSDYRFYTILLNKKKSFIDGFRSVLVKDNPDLGTDAFASNSSIDQNSELLDLSFSFPQPSEQAFDYATIMIDPNASLGIPARFFMVFSRNDFEIDDKFQLDISNTEIDKDTFILNKVLDDYVQKGIEVLIRESNYKAAVLNQLIESSNHLKPVAENSNRSKTVMIADCTPLLFEQITKMGYDVKSRITEDRIEITIANYPTHSKELIEMFSDRLAVLL